MHHFMISKLQCAAHPSKNHQMLPITNKESEVLWKSKLKYEYHINIVQYLDHRGTPVTYQAP